MYVRTGVNDYELAVVISDPAEVRDGTIGVIAIDSILALQHTGKPIQLNPAVDFINGYDAGRVDVSAEELRRLNRWVAAGYVVTVKANAGGKIRFGRVPFAKLGLTEEQDFWLKAWAESMDYEAEKRKAAARPQPQPQPEAKPAPLRKEVKLKRKDRRAMDRIRAMEAANV